MLLINWDNIECTPLPTKSPMLPPSPTPSTEPTSSAKVSESNTTQFGLNVTIIFKEILTINVTDDIIMALLEYSDTIRGELVENCNNGGYKYYMNRERNMTIIKITILVCNEQDEQLLISHYRNKNELDDLIPEGVESEILVEPFYRSKEEISGNTEEQESAILMILIIIGSVFVCSSILVFILIKIRKRMYSQKNNTMIAANCNLAMTKVESVSMDQQEEEDAEELYGSGDIEQTKGETEGKDELNSSQRNIQNSMDRSFSRDNTGKGESTAANKHNVPMTITKASGDV